MVSEVKDYISTCLDCRRNKAAWHKSYGLLQSFPASIGSRRNWAMDFITDLPPSLRRRLVYDAILVVVDRFSKYSRYISARKD